MRSILSIFIISAAVATAATLFDASSAGAANERPAVRHDAPARVEARRTDAWRGGGRDYGRRTTNYNGYYYPPSAGIGYAPYYGNGYPAYGYGYYDTYPGPNGFYAPNYYGAPYVYGQVSRHPSFGFGWW
jgi:hypothetical protein